MPKGRTREEMLKVGANTRFKAGKAQSEIAKMGAAAMHAKEKEKKAMKEVALEKLNSMLPSGKSVQEGLINNAVVLAGKQYAKLDDIIKLLVFLRDTSGQKPIEKKSLVDSAGEDVTPVVINIMGM